jgi:hypothetical protein
LETEPSAVGKQSPGRTSQAELPASPADISVNQEETGRQANPTVGQEEDEIASDGDRCQESGAVDSLKDSARKNPTRKKIVRHQVSYESMCISV